MTRKESGFSQIVLIVIIAAAILGGSVSYYQNSARQNMPLPQVQEGGQPQTTGQQQLTPLDRAPVTVQTASAAVFERAPALAAKPLGPGQIGMLEYQAGFDRPIVLNAEQAESLRSQLEAIRSRPADESRIADFQQWRLIARDKGTVTELKPGKGPRGVWNSRMVQGGHWVITGPDSRATIVLADQSRIVIGPNSVVRTDQLVLQPQPAAQAITAKVTNMFGKIMVNAQRNVQRLLGGQQSHEVQTPNAVIGARGTIFETEVVSDTETIVQVFEGAVDITTNTGKKLTLESGKRIAIQGENGEILSAIGEAHFSEPFTITAGAEGQESNEILLWTVAKPPMRVVFNRPIDPASVTPDNVFAKDETGSHIAGLTRIRGTDEIIFYPLEPLDPAKRYLFTVNRAIRDRWGNALEKDWEIPYRVARASAAGLTYTLGAPRFFEVVRTFELWNNGPGEATNGSLSMSHFRQNPPSAYLQFEGYSQEPDKVIEDGAGNKIARWTFDKPIKAGEKIKIEMRYHALAFSTDFTSFLRSDSAGEATDEKQDLAPFLLPEKNIESDASQIRALAAEIIRGETDPLRKAEKINRWIVDNVSYDILFGDDIKPENENRQGARATITRKTATCYEFANLFVALARASGVPARAVLGWTPLEDENVINEGHAWAEFYVPGRSWIPVDPTWGAFTHENVTGFTTSDGPHLAEFLNIPGKTNAEEANRVRAYYHAGTDLQAYFYITISELQPPVSGLGDDTFLNELSRAVTGLNEAFARSPEADAISDKYFLAYAKRIASANLLVGKAVERYSQDKIAALALLNQAENEAQTLERNLSIRQNIGLIIIFVLVAFLIFWMVILWIKRRFSSSKKIKL